MLEQDRTVMARTIVITCAGYALINYTYQRPKPLPALNPMGNFYRGSHYHKSTQRFFDELIENGSLPQAGDVFELSDKNLKLTVTSVTTNFQPSALSRELMRMEEELKDKQYERAQLTRGKDCG
ncbi:hypothetical protein OA099_01635 [Litorivicinus sp.]|nr:hypothetical protein [Litorivicinus sp.]